MKTKFILLLLLISSTLFAQRSTQYTVLSDNENGIVVDVQVGEITQQNIATSLGNAVKISINKGVSMLEKNAPDLPKLSFSICIDNQKNTTLSILEREYTDYTNVLVAPSKGKIYRNEKPSEIPYVYGKQYLQNEFFPQQISYLNTPFISRDLRGQTVQLNPVQYNPITKTMRVYSHLKVKITYSGISNENIISSSKAFAIPQEFATMYANQFINHSTAKALYAPITQEGSMLILTPSAFLTTIQPYNTWKQMKGVKTFVVTTDTITGGVSDSTIKKLVKWYYDTYHILYLTIVGDHNSIPTNDVFYGIAGLMGPGDNSYGYLAGNDHNPELLVGRFSGNTVTEIATQINKTVQYEKTPNTSNNWMQRQIGIASDQGPGDDNEFDYEHICNIMDSNKNQYTYVNNNGYFDGAQTGCNDNASSPVPSDIITEFNNGIGLLNYCGHGSNNAFSTSGFSSTDVTSLTNTNGKWPFIFSTACVNGNFMFTTCLAESLMQSTDNAGNPTGTIATLMSTINQSWDPPMQGQDEMNAILRGARPNNKKTTFGCLAANGNMSVIEKYNTSSDPQGGDEIADTWNVFGDPNLEVRTKNEGAIICSHSGWIQQNSTSCNVACNVEGATIGLYYKNKYWGTSSVTGGIAYFNNFEPLDILDTLFITATKQNYTPYFGYMKVENYPVAVGNIDINKNISIFPNPFVNEIEIILKNNNLIQEINLIDLTGKICLSTKENVVKTKINTTNIHPGIYLLEIKTSEGIFKQKLVK